jgi:uracil-DNA glycosylase family 4
LHKPDPLHLEALAKTNLRLARCVSCSLYTTPGCPVPAIAGSKTPKVFFVGEAPGATEAEPTGYTLDAAPAVIPTGRPFVGFSGKKLKEAIAQAGFELEDIVVTNAVKHRPPDNRTPTAEEYKTCSQYLKEEIEILKPKHIIALGAIPSRALAHLAGINLPASGLRGKTFDCLGAKVYCTWHPAYAFGYNKKAAVDLEQDLTAVAQLLEKK